MKPLDIGLYISAIGKDETDQGKSVIPFTIIIANEDEKRPHRLSNRQMAAFLTLLFRDLSGSNFANVQVTEDMEILSASVDDMVTNKTFDGRINHLLLPAYCSYLLQEKRQRKEER